MAISGPDQKYIYPRRGSLPTLHEYDSDDGSSIREPQLYPSTVYRRYFQVQIGNLATFSSFWSCRSINKSEADLRSMSELTVDFGRYPESSGRSQTAPDSPFLVLHKSLSQPSLGRSISEFTDRDR